MADERQAAKGGERLFARYAYAPNHLGYCGPADSAALAELASTGQTDADVRSIASRFSGAWPYLCVLAELAGIADPLDERVVRAYNRVLAARRGGSAEVLAESARPDRRRRGRAVLDAPQARADLGGDAHPRVPRLLRLPVDRPAGR